MTRWTSKKPFWPFISALGCLFLLAVAAPNSWHRYQPTLQSGIEVIIASEPAVSEPLQKVVALEPIIELPLPNLQISAQELVVEVIATPAIALIPTLAPLQDNSSDDASSDIVVAAPPIEESLSSQQNFDFDVLMQMRDALLSIVDRLPDQQQPRETINAEPSVLVTSENDRLAMIDTRHRRKIEPRNRSESEPVTEKIAASEQFSHLLSKAAQRFQANNDQEKMLARRPADRPQSSVEVPTPAKVIQPLIRQYPKVLFEQLEALAAVSQASHWSHQVVGQLQKLTAENPAHQSDALTILQELRSLVETGDDLAMQVSSPAAQQDWLQANQALQRRLEIWQALLESTQSPITPTDLSASQSNLSPILGEVATLLASESNGKAWRGYLLLDHFADASSEGVGIESKERAKLALKVLARMSNPRLNELQQHFLATPLLLSLRKQLQPWTTLPIDLDRLMALVERYEDKRELRYAAAIARLQQQLAWSGQAHWLSLSNHLKQHYRSANMRIAFSDELLNRMIPKQRATMSSVNDRIAGAKVRGNARTTTNLQVRLLPDPNRWQFSLEASGRVFSNTQSDTWPARVRNTAKMQYDVKKVIVIDQQGLVASPAKATAKGRHDLIGVDSQLDSVPLFGALLREIARNKNQKSRPTAMAQVKAKVVREARQRMDKEADPKLSNLEQRFRDGVLAPIGQLALIADPLAIYTTDDRAVMQLRLANDGQLGAHTPRPLAPSDSVASMQMHETVLNNALAGLQLEGRRMKLPELFHFFSKKFGNVEVALPEDLPTRAVIEFAARDAILVHCDGDCLKLTLSIRELAQGRDKIRNFQVHARFQPVLEGLAVTLVRDGSLQFSGYRLKTGPRIVLHSVLGKVLPKGQEIKLLANNLQDDPRFAGLMVTQLVIDDGWIGLALGPANPERTAWRTRTSEKDARAY